MRKAVQLTMALVAVAGMTAMAGVAEAKCVKKGAIGSASDEAGAKLQVDEALLQAVDWGAWAAWMGSSNKVGAAAKVGGYSFGKRTYRCNKGGSWGWTCRGQATICKI